MTYTFAGPVGGQTIYKYPVFGQAFSLVMPEGSQILHLEVQREQPYLWVLHDLSKQMKNFFFSAYGTGQWVPEQPGKYVGTWHDSMGLVWHLFQT